MCRQVKAILRLEGASSLDHLVLVVFLFLVVAAKSGVKLFTDFK